MVTASFKLNEVVILGPDCADTVASAINRLIPEDALVPWTQLQGQFCIDNDIKESRSAQLMLMLPTLESEATLVSVSGVVIWTSKTGQRGSRLLHKKTDPQRVRKIVIKIHSDHPL